MVNYFRNELEKSYNYLADIIILEDKEEDGLVYNEKEVLKYTDVRCSISQNTYYPTLQGDVPSSTMIIKLFINPDIIVPINSKIVIKKNNIEKKYKSSSAAAMYDTHQEIELECIENG